MTSAPRTCVLQSFREGLLPAWTARCFASVEAWATARGDARVLLGDALFEPVPAWYRAKVSENKVAMSDLGRLAWARRLLDEGYGQVIWVDADLLVFDAAHVRLPEGAGHAFAREVWTERAPTGELLSALRVNNAVCAFRRGDPFLPFYEDACLRVVRDAKGPVDKLEVGTRLLTALALAVPLPLVEGVAMVSPTVARDVLAGAGPAARATVRKAKGRFGAANLCASFHAAGDDGPLDALADALAAEQGRALNQYAV